MRHRLVRAITKNLCRWLIGVVLSPPICWRSQPREFIWWPDRGRCNWVSWKSGSLLSTNPLLRMWWSILGDLDKRWQALRMPSWRGGYFLFNVEVSAEPGFVLTLSGRFAIMPTILCHSGPLWFYGCHHARGCLALPGWNTPLWLSMCFPISRRWLLATANSW